MLKYQFEFPLDDPRRNIQHGQIIRSKKFLLNIYKDWYQYFQNAMKELPNDNVVELGSGGGFLKELLPNIITSDIIPLPGNSLTFSALDMPFENKSLGGIFMVDTMHHIPDSHRFLSEVSRTLMHNGVVLMIEPANTFWGRFIFQNFHHEPFNPKGGWTIPSSGPMSDANGALPWIVFVRDKVRFQENFPDLKIEYIHYIKPFSYLFSGGVSRKQLLPDFLYPLIKKADDIIPKIIPGFSMFMVIKLKKIEKQ